MDGEIKRLLLDAFPVCLSTRDWQIIQMRYGLVDGRARSLQEIGNYFGVTRERIRQIERKAIRKFKHPSRIKKVEQYVAEKKEEQ